MDTTSVSLLRRLNSSERESAWERFVELYAPLVFHWGVDQGLTTTDAADLVQEVMAILIVKLPDFQYNSGMRFRGWLRTITRNKATDFHRRNSVRAGRELEDTLLQADAPSAADLFEEDEYRNYLIRRSFELMESDFEPTTWQACWQLVAESRSAAVVAAELGISPTAARVAKSRVLRRLREELQGLLE